ncbi:MAG: hypothetical protein LBB94_09160 [Clostridiales bacterium]|nr:hypothetical protein [Clostridiales bacterium]
MKKYILSLVCVGVIAGSIAVAAGLSYMSPESEKSGDAGNPPAASGRNEAAQSASDNAAPSSAPVRTPEPTRIKPTTKIIYEYFYQADNRTITSEESPLYFLVDLSSDKIKEYYPDWDIIEFNEDRVKLRRIVLPEPSEDQYVLGVKDNYVAVYQKSGSGGVSLKDVTATPLSSLSIDERNKLITGVNVKNDDHLAQMLEDYGS